MLFARARPAPHTAALGSPASGYKDRVRARFRHVAVLVVAMVVLHRLALAADMYYRYRWADDVLQLLGGVAAGVLWLRLVQILRVGEPSALFVGATVVAFAVTAGFAWELSEFGRWWWTSGSHVYHPNLPHMLVDIAVSGAGGAVAALAWDTAPGEPPPIPRPGVLRPSTR